MTRETLGLCIFLRGGGGGAGYREPFAGLRCLNSPDDDPDVAGDPISRHSTDTRLSSSDEDDDLRRDEDGDEEEDGGTLMCDGDLRSVSLIGSTTTSSLSSRSVFAGKKRQS